MATLKKSATQAGPASKTFSWHASTGLLIHPDGDGDRELPGIADLLSSLRFSPKEGRIWLDVEPVSLIYLSTMAAMQGELIEMLGEREARGLLTRLGYAAGARNAALSRKLRSQQILQDAFLVGPQVHAMQGIAAMQPMLLEADVSTGHFYGEVKFSGSFEADARLSDGKTSDSGVCWVQIGVASGFTSAFMGRPVLFKEVECRATGSEYCRMIGKTLNDWEKDEISEELQALQPHLFANRPRKAWPSGHSSTAAEKDNLIDTSGHVVGASPAFVATCHMIQKVADTSATVLFLGETGVGKEIFAQTLHHISKRHEQPLVTINCAAIPDGLIEAELFGVEKGAFTGATQSRPGRFERAHGGTLFLDEVGTLTMAAQIKLLRAIQEKEIERVGDTITRQVDVRLIAATNEDIKTAVKEGRFREDLLYRLNVFPISIPPLRERREDIPLLMELFVQRFTHMHQKHITGFTEQAVDALFQYDYPGNIRELENMIERAVIMADEHQPISVDDLFASQDFLALAMLKVDGSGTLTRDANTAPEPDLLADIVTRGVPMSEFEGGLIDEAIKRANGNIAKAARMLGLKRTYLDYRLKKKSTG